MTKLSDTQRVILSAAAQHEMGLARAPKTLPAAARNAVFRSLIKTKLLTEINAPREHVGLGWRQDEDGTWIVARITDEGLRAIGIDPNEGDAKAAAPVADTAPTGGEHAGEGDAPAEEAEPAQGAPTPTPRASLRDAAVAVLAAWDDEANRETDIIAALDSPMGTLRAALAGKPPRAPREPGAPRKPREGTKQESVLAMLRREPTYRQIFLRRDFRDFKPHRHLRIGDFPTLLPLAENGEIQVGTMSESQEIVLLQTFARRIRVTRPMLVNDDLGAFTDFAAAIGRRVAEFENATAYNLLNSANGDGPTLTNGGATVFATGAARANKASTGTVLDTSTIGAGRTAIMKQRTLDGLPISMGQTMRLLVGPNLELAARQATVVVQASEIGKANVFAGFVQPVIEPLIQANRWYLFSDPVAAPVYVYGYLNGAEGPQVTTGPVQGADGVEVSVIFDFGVGAIDWRGAWFNPGT